MPVQVQDQVKEEVQQLHGVGFFQRARGRASQPAALCRGSKSVESVLP
jgi:hypothetical protein